MTSFAPTGILSLDCALGGGWPQGKVAEVYGDDGAGKSTLALHAIAACQHSGAIVSMITMARRQRAFDVVYGRRFGVDPARLVVADAQPSMLPALLHSCCDGKHPPELVVVELVAPTDLIEAASLYGALSVFFRAFCARRRKVSLLFVTDGASLPLRYYASTRVCLALEGETPGGDSLVTATITKSKDVAPFQQVSLQLTPGDGFDTVKDVVRAAAYAGVLSADEIEPTCQRILVDAAARENLAHTVRRKLFLKALVS